MRRIHLFISFMAITLLCHTLLNGKPIAGIEKGIGPDTNRFRQRVMADSINTVKRIAFAMAYANKYKDQDSFTYNSKRLCIDSGFLSMNYGHLFNKKSKHLLVRIPYNDSKDVFYDRLIVAIYVLDTTQKFTLVRADTCYFHSYTGDTIFDVNGDGYKDFVVTTSGLTGCCPRDEEFIYLYNKDCAAFAAPIEVSNPDYYPDRIMLFQMDYGWPGWVAIHKCFWNGTELNTVETIKLDNSHPEVFIVEDEKTGKKTSVRGLPPEYKTFNRLNWFLDSPVVDE
jgi:hypothetical protein